MLSVWDYFFEHLSYSNLKDASRQQNSYADNEKPFKNKPFGAFYRLLVTS
jgi:hypothetical protein